MTTRLDTDLGHFQVTIWGADKSLARIDNSYVKIKYVSCLSSL